ncbi:MAG: hypothetical protein AAFV54_00070, partial [Pseudomonadota bacterium]
MITFIQIVTTRFLLLAERMKDDQQLSLGLVSPENPSALTRKRWRHLVERRLPEAAPNRKWPINADHCFVRVLLDNVLEVPWRTVVRPPAWRNTPVHDLERAIKLGEAVLS